MRVQEKESVKRGLPASMRTFLAETRSESKDKHFVYILQSADGRYYTGYTTDLKRRFREHRSGSGGKFTRSFGAEIILYHEVYDSKSEALKREAQIKGLSKKKKTDLIQGEPKLKTTPPD